VIDYCCLAANIFVRVKPGTVNEPQVVLLDHGLCKELTDSFRVSYCELWKNLILQNDEKVKQYCEQIGVPREDYKLFAELVLMRSYESGNIGLSSKITKKQLEEVKKLFAQQMHRMVDLMKKMPREMVLVMRNK